MDRIHTMHPPGSPRPEYPNAERIIDRLLRRAVAGPGSCLIWAGSTDRDNYGRTQIDNREHRVHRVVYKLLVGPAAEGELVDHTCHNEDTACPGGRECLHRRCLNPHHLTLATHRENLLRSDRSTAGRNAGKTHCSKGHPFDGENVYVDAKGHRICRACRNAGVRAFKARQRAAAGGVR